MNYPWYRRGTFAVVDGLSYPVSYSVGDPLVRLPSTSRPLPAEACEQIVSVQVYATYRGHGVLVDDVDEDGNARVMEAEWDELWATVNGFVHESRYEYFKTVDLCELRDYYEKQTDLLFLRWREARFARPADRRRFGFDADAMSGEPAVVDGRPRSGKVRLEDGRHTEVTTRAEYLGYPCEIVAISPSGSVGLYYLGTDESRAEADGFELTADLRWAKTVHIYDLARYQEHHRDLDFEAWRTAAEPLPRRGADNHG